MAYDTVSYHFLVQLLFSRMIQYSFECRPSHKNAFFTFNSILTVNAILNLQVQLRPRRLPKEVSITKWTASFFEFRLVKMKVSCLFLLFLSLPVVLCRLNSQPKGQMDSDVHAEQQPQLHVLNLTNEVRMTWSFLSSITVQHLLLTKVFAELIDLLLSWKWSPSDWSYWTSVRRKPTWGVH